MNTNIDDIIEFEDDDLPFQFEGAEELDLTESLITNQDQDQNDHKDQNQNQDQDEETESDVDYEAYLTLLKDDGFLSLPEDFKIENSKEAFQKAKELTKKITREQLKNEILETLPEGFSAVKEYVEKGGTDIYGFLALQSNQDYYENFSIEDDSDRDLVLQEYLEKSTTFSPEKIMAQVELLKKDRDRYEIEAIEALQSLQNFSAQEKQQKLLDEIEQNKIIKEKQEAEVNTILKLIKEDSVISPERKGKVQSFLFNPIKKGNNVNTEFARALSNILSKPEHYIQFADFLQSSYDPEKGFSYERYERRSASRETKQIKNKIDAIIASKQRQQPSPKTGTNSKFDWEMFLKQAD